jgi:subtilisin family serine protease
MGRRRISLLVALVLAIGLFVEPGLGQERMRAHAGGIPQGFGPAAEGEFGRGPFWPGRRLPRSPDNGYPAYLPADDLIPPASFGPNVRAAAAGRARKLAANALLPPAGETRFRGGEIVVTISSSVAPATVAQVLQRHRLVAVEATTISKGRTTLHLWRIPGPRDVRQVIRELGGEPSLAGVQPNYVYRLEGQTDGAPSPQYALAKLNVDGSLDIATPAPIRVALIDTAVDDAHPALTGAIEATHDTLGGAAKNQEHGTAMAGAIAAHGDVAGVAPHAHILVVRALDADASGAVQGTSYSVTAAVDWAVDAKAKVINMSFAGPADPLLHDALAEAVKSGVALIAAVGNDGPKAAPMYPAADPLVIAVTATDADDHLYARAVVGPHVAVAAPGVDVILPAPQSRYALETGTSVSAALVTGVVALLLERRPTAAPAEIADWLKGAARPLGAASSRLLFGAGMVDAKRAILAAASVATK